MEITYRKATQKDLDLYFNWANDEGTRLNSFSSQVIDYQEHTNWFLMKILDSMALMLVFENQQKQAIGQVRIEQKTTENVIGISVDKAFRGKGFSSEMIALASQEFFKNFPCNEINAYIKKII